jgi:hypothetical protein
LFGEIRMAVKILYRKDIKKIYFIITHKNIILEYDHKNSKQIYSAIIAIKNNLKINKKSKNYLIADDIRRDLLKIISASEFFSK